MSADRTAEVFESSDARLQLKIELIVVEEDGLLESREFGNSKTAIEASGESSSE